MLHIRLLHIEELAVKVSFLTWRGIFLVGVEQLSLLYEEDRKGEE